ncbi:MAG: hypothetical protein Q8O37_12110 [Sulfuricellaceae bacterium]|nr:hypothetical protein [Sulfuricellaceae bacterium]
MLVSAVVRVEALAEEVEAEHGSSGAEAAVDAAIAVFRNAFGAVANKIRDCSA